MTTEIIAKLEKNHELSVREVDPTKNSPIPPYFGLGKRGRSKHKIDGVDAAYLLSTLSGRSAWFFWTLVTLRDYQSNLTDIRQHRLGTHLTSKELGRIPRAYAELKNKGLVVRYNKGIYLVNPKVVLPEFAKFEATWDKWVATRNKHGLTK